MTKKSELLLRQIILAKTGQIEEGKRNRYPGWEDRVKDHKAAIAKAEAELLEMRQVQEAILPAVHQPVSLVGWVHQVQQQQTGVILPKK